MKSLIKILIVALLFFVTQPGYSQSGYTSSISVDIIPMNPQSGMYNYFGVSVTLDRSYDQPITVSGYIFEAGSAPNTNNPFSITVSAGNTTNSTSSTFFQANPTADASITLSAIAPATVTSSGLSYSTQYLIVGSGPENSSNPFDYAGLEHNRALDYILSTQPTLSSASAVASAVTSYFSNYTVDGSSASSFFSSSTTASYVSSFAGASNINTVFSNNGLSSEFCSYYASLMSAADYAEDYYSIYGSIVSVESSISSSSTLTSAEKQILLVGASVLRYSFYYWGVDETISSWESYTGQTYTKLHKSPLLKPMEKPLLNSVAYDGILSISNSIISATPVISILTSPSLSEDNELDESHEVNPINYQAPRYMSMRNEKYAPLNAPFYMYIKWSWKSFGRADGKGAIEGAVAGGLGGCWLAGPPRGLAGAVGGGIGWGAACSVSNAVGQLTGWW